MVITLTCTWCFPTMHLEDASDVCFTGDLDVTTHLVNVESVVSRMNALISGNSKTFAAHSGMTVIDGNQLLSSQGCLGGNGKVVNLSTDENKFTIDLTLLDTSCAHG